MSQSDIPGVTNVGFGNVVAISSNGDVIVVGASSQVTSEAGRAYVYRYDSNDWMIEQMLEASNPEGTDHFGISVSINAAGDRIVVGADFEDGYSDQIKDTGAVYVFDHNGNSWSQTQMLRTSPAERNIRFGFAVDLSADGLQLAVGSLYGKSLYSYDLSNVNTTQWSASEKRFNSPSSANFFGASVALNGSASLAGSYFDDYNYNGIVTNSDNNQVFDDNDTSSTGTDFNNLDMTLTDSGGVYVIAPESYALSSLDSLQATVDASNAILAWAAGGTTQPTEQDYIDAVITDVTDENLNDINIQLQTLEHSDMFDIQPMVDAINKILAYSASSAASPTDAPTDDDYQLAGVPLFAPTAADLNAEIWNKSYTIQEILAIYPIPQPRLDVDTPLHVNDTIGWLNQQQVEDAFNLYQNSNSGDTLSYLWQFKSSTDTSWTDVSVLQDISAYSDLASLVVGLEYRLLLKVTRTYADYTNFSDATSLVIGGLTTDTDIDMSWDVLNPPQEGVPYTVVSRLEPVTNYKDRVLTWYSLDSGTLVQLQQGERYTPDSSRVDNPLVVNVAYYAANGDVILARDILTPDVIAAPISTDLTDLAGVLSLALTPDGVSVGALVSLTAADMNEIANASAVTVAYQWQAGSVGSWSNVAGTGTGTGNGASYVAQVGDVGERLHLVLTLADAGTNESIDLTSQYSGVVQANDMGLETFTLLLEFDGSLLSLASASAERLTTFMSDESLVNPTYAWLRMPASGGGFEVGAEVGTDAGGYTFNAAVDVGFRHGLRVTLEDSNGQTVTLFSNIT
ncbi:FG-GAP repeat protein, partial [Vibrio sp. 10N.286.46.E10]|uniref:FG-GAP repeat protein n=1 Tax=Vibrio sp. 10N.286.46.E10 TaxID=1884477 RepID=UPI0015E6C85D